MPNGFGDVLVVQNDKFALQRIKFAGSKAFAQASLRHCERGNTAELTQQNTGKFSVHNSRSAR